MTFIEKYFKLKNELKAKRRKKEQIEQIILEMTFQKTKFENIIEFSEIGLIPLNIATFSIILSNSNIKNSVLLLLIVLFEIIIGLTIVDNAKICSCQLESLINMSEQLLKK